MPAERQPPPGGIVGYACCSQRSRSLEKVCELSDILAVVVDQQLPVLRVHARCPWLANDGATDERAQTRRRQSRGGLPESRTFKPTDSAEARDLRFQIAAGRGRRELRVHAQEPENVAEYITAAAGLLAAPGPIAAAQSAARRGLAPANITDLKVMLTQPGPDHLVLVKPLTSEPQASLARIT